MILLPVSELELMGVVDRGVANSERIVFRAVQSVEMAQFGVLVGTVGMANGMQILTPSVDRFFWFGPGPIDAGDWIYLYTGAGEYRRTTVQDTSIPAHVVHWGRDTTLFARSEMVPALIRIGGITIADGPKDVPQAAQHRLTSQ
jgi:hypothetical protein